jgi:protein-L-isoaspartate(D-aspartate) O-methyltransferase
MLDFAKARRMMVDSQLRTFDVNDLAVLTAFDEVPRERFVPPGREGLAYMDQDLPVAEGVNGAERRFMLSPMVLARMIQALDLSPGDKVLDVASGLGYSSAVLARLGCSVVALEADEHLAAQLRQGLAAGAVKALVGMGPLEQGYPDAAPYHAILVNGAVETRPEALLRQLADHGRLACVEGRGRSARATLTVRSGGAFGSRPLFDAAAPPLAAFRAEPGFVF